MYGRWWRMKDKHRNTIGSPFIIGKQNDYAFSPAFHEVSDEHFKQNKLKNF